jgi:hypothetical protein
MKEVMVMGLLAIVLFSQTANAQISPYANRLLLPHIYPGQTITSTDNWQMEHLSVGSSTVRWTENGAYSINVDKIHLDRKSYTLLIKSRQGPEIRFVPFTETELVLGNQTYQASYHKKTYKIWLSLYPK